MIHNLKVVGSKIAGEVTLSFTNGEITWLVSNAPDDASFTATGAAGIVGVNVDVAFWPKVSVT